MTRGPLTLAEVLRADLARGEMVRPHDVDSLVELRDGTAHLSPWRPGEREAALALRDELAAREGRR